ncbi:MAG TPA: hypothetical protein VF181_10670, partial [Balneolaceae bacterium]
MKYCKISIICLALYFTAACSANKTVQIAGNIDYVGSAEIFISKKPLHYKYSDKVQFPINPENGKFEVSVAVDSTQIIRLHIDGQAYPLIATPGQPL